MRSYDEYKKIVTEHLYDYLPLAPSDASTVDAAMRYSLGAGGKRLRPVMLLAACDFAGGDIMEALPYAIAIEYIHTYSLIHDDLPAMDDDDLRRGKPTCHKVYGEAIAILAGDGLLNSAAELMSKDLSNYYDNQVKLVAHAKAQYEILNAAGVQGMIAGQISDIENENNVASADLVEFIHANKTGKLLTCPIVAGMLLGNAKEELADKFRSYAMKLGKAFQISDDILDFEGDSKTLGKTIGKDLKDGKCSYVCVHGLDEAKDKLHELTDGAIATLSDMNEDDSEFFIELARKLEIRKA
ncbi:MAG: polyprenyl synthetase family protein [Clostridiales bacterium]|jgi:geranylgeranyl diphosphate synthase type II|nr:polyprenyl synthetase family protein [Clostridiales bacterium]